MKSGCAGSSFGDDDADQAEASAGITPQAKAFGENAAALVVDGGSNTFKAGFAGDDTPSTIFPNIVGRPKSTSAIVGRASPVVSAIDRRDSLVGVQAVTQSTNLALKSPMERGVVTNWDDMEVVWRHSFAEELGVDPESQAILLVEPPLNPKASRERTAQVMFETFEVPALYMVSQAVLALRAVDRTTGVVVDSGADNSYATPVFEGYVIPQAIQCLHLAGNDLTEFMAKLLIERHGPGLVSSDSQVSRQIKEQSAFVALDYTAESEAAKEKADRGKAHALMDGGSVIVGSERFKCPEALFKPGFVGKEDGKGIHHMTYQSIQQCDFDIRTVLFANIILSGGNMMFPGIAERMAKELNILVNGLSTIDVVAPPKRKVLAWIGGSLVSAESSFLQMCISKAEFDLMGPSVVHIKCI